MLLDLSVDALITIITILSIFVLLLVTKLPADFVFLGGITVLLMTGVLDAKQAFAGFSSSTVIVIGLLFVVIAGLIHTGVLRWIVKHTLGKPKNHSRAILKIMAITAALSAFLNNTVVVALFVNVVKIWSKKLNLAPSKLLIPLSYAAGMGGICTLIGTPPNMIISELYARESGEALGFFCIALMISVSSSFATPIGSPTHMLVYGPGGYRFADFIRIGLPMNLIMLAANIFITTLLFPL